MATALAETNYHHALSIPTDPSAVAGLWLPSPPPPPPPPHSDPTSFLSRQLSPISPYQVCNHARENNINNNTLTMASFVVHVVGHFGMYSEGNLR